MWCRAVSSVLALDGLNGRDPVCLQVVRVDLQPQLGQLLLGVVGVQGLGNPHGPLNHPLVAGLFGRLQVIHQGDVVAAPLGGYFGRKAAGTVLPVRNRRIRMSAGFGSVF